MDIHFKSPSEPISANVYDHIEKKLERMSKLIQDSTYETQVFVDLSRESGANVSDKMWRASINLDQHGTRINASEIAPTPEKASAAALKELKYELREANAKNRTANRRQASFWKDLRKSFSS